MPGRVKFEKVNKFAISKYSECPYCHKNDLFAFLTDHGCDSETHKMYCLSFRHVMPQLPHNSHPMEREDKK